MVAGVPYTMEMSQFSDSYQPTHEGSPSNTASPDSFPPHNTPRQRRHLMLFINEFIRDHSEAIERPIKQGNRLGFLLNNGFRLFFRDWKLTTKSRGTLSRLYKKKGIIQ
jgi:hypothetical protein